MLASFVATYRAGNRAAAVDGFWTFVGGPGWREEMRRTVPSGPEQAVTDAPAAFESDLPSPRVWRFGAEQAAAIDRPVLHIVGADSLPAFRAGAGLLRSWLPRLESVTLPGANHLLQVQQPGRVAAFVADFLSRTCGRAHRS